LSHRNEQENKENPIHESADTHLHIAIKEDTVNHPLDYNKLEETSSPIKVSIRTSSPSRRGKTQSRVLIHQARGKAAAMGISAGMVVSHFNGEEFHGTADELKQSLYKLHMAGEENQSFTMVLNADLYTAEVLKMRASFREEEE
jgi:diphthamide synthase (EF-2-diphthine--ammonia ligase)